MHPLRAALACAVCTAPLPALAKPDETILLNRTGKWQVNYDDDSCSLFAQFGEGKQASVLRMTQFEPGDWFDATLYGRPFKGTGASANVAVAFNPQAKPTSRKALRATTGKDTPTLLLGGVRVDDWTYTSPDAIAPVVTRQQEAAATGLTVRILDDKTYRFEAGPFDKPIGAMRTCLVDLVKHWGFDPEVQSHLTRRPLPLTAPITWLNSSDYPSDALRSGHQGVVQFRLDVDLEGRVTGCHILFRTNPDDFGDITCRNVTQRAKFAPALDADGKPINSYFIHAVRWNIPD